MNSIDVLKMITRWSAPYTPFAPLELEEIHSEMKETALTLSPNDIYDLVNIMSGIDDEDQNIIFGQFMYQYISYHKNSIAVALINSLRHNGPKQIIELIGYTQDPKLYKFLHEKVNYELLDIETKYSLIDAFDYLRNTDAIEYLCTIKNSENDTGIIDEINLVISKLERIK